MSEPMLKERVNQFYALKLPGQPMMMHMGTSYLVGDLAARITELEAERDKAVRLVGDMVKAQVELEKRAFKIDAASVICRRDIEALMTSCDKLEARNTELEGERDKAQRLCGELLQSSHATEVKLVNAEAERDRWKKACKAWEAQSLEDAGELDRLKAALADVASQRTMSGAWAAMRRARAALSDPSGE